MNIENIPSSKAGLVAVAGRPNVGKSTLINALLGQKVAAVSPRPQTTRKLQQAILTLENAQVILVDTPGTHHPHHKLGELMNEEAKESLEDCDIILWLMDASQPPDADDHLLVNQVANIKLSLPIILALNKIDLISEEILQGRQETYLSLLSSRRIPLDNIRTIPISATRGDNLDVLLQEVIKHLPEGEPFYPESQVTDLYEREIAADLIREAALIHLRDEVPYSIFVRVDDYIERGEHGAYVTATLYVERESHKPIVIGQGGNMLKKIGSTARQEIEAMSGRKIFLELRVKLSKNWRNDPDVLRSFGFGR